MNAKHVRNFESLGEKIELILILNFTPIRKQQRDKDAPKKTRTAYTFFCQKNRPETMEKMNENSREEPVKSVDVVRAFAERWKELKFRCECRDEDSLAEMDGYKSQSIEDMGRYHIENDAYMKRMQSQPE